MNIDILENNPSWVYFVYLSIPMLVLIVLFTFVLKHFRWFLSAALHAKFFDKTMKASEERLISVKVNLEETRQDGNLMWAAKTGQKELVRLLLEKGANVDAAQEGLTALHWATRYAHAGAAEMLAARAENVNTVDELGCTPLHWVARNGLTSIAEILLEKGAYYNALDNEGMTPNAWASQNENYDICTILEKRVFDAETELHTAIESGVFEDVLQLLNAGVSLDARDINGRTPLHLAAALGNLEVVKALLEHRSDPELPDANKRTALHLAVECGNLELVLFLVGLGANLDARDEWEETPLHLAAYSGSADIVGRLVSSGAIMHAVSRDGNLPIHAAAARGHAQVVELLIDQAESWERPNMVNARNIIQHTPLHLAAVKSEATVMVLLRAGADPNAVAGPDSTTAAAVAAEAGKGRVLKILLDHTPATTKETLSVLMKIGLDHGHADVFRVLHDHGVRIDYITSDNNAIWRAFRSGNLDLCKIFFEGGFDVRTVGPLGMTALHFAAGAGQGEVVRQLLNQGSGVSAVDDWGWTALHTAAAGGHETTVELLLQNGADREIRDSYQWLPVHLAASSRYDGVVRLLTDGEQDSRDVHDFPRNRWGKETASTYTPSFIAARVVTGAFVITELAG
jgi:cytohesin